MKLISLIVPVYNEQEMLPIFFEKIEEIFHDNIDYKYEFLLIDDGSSDGTLALIKEAAKKSKRISYASFSKNFGQEAAVEAGLKSAKGDVVIPIDCDLQDPPEVIFKLLEKYEEGYEVVNAKRAHRNDDTKMKRGTAGLFYTLTNKIAKKEVIADNVCFFRLMTRRVVNYINSLPESTRIVRAEVPYVGFKTTEVLFDRVERKAGKTKYNYSKLLDVAGKTFTAATPNLLKYPFKISCFMVPITGLLTLILLITSTIFSEISLSGYFRIMPWFILFACLFAASIAILIFSIHSLYLRNIYTNTINRPNFFIAEMHTAENALNSDVNELNDNLE